MKRTSGLTTALGAAILLLTAPSVCSPPPLLGQQADSLRIEDDSLRIENDLLVRFAKAHVAVTEARDAFYSELARTHDQQGQARLRADLSETLAEIMATHDLTAEVFEHLTAVVSADAEERARFEKILAELVRDPGGDRSGA